jgi:OFA family oxalate/formate antiporter-like MFS transporter
VFLLNTTVGLVIYSDARALAESIGGATAAAASAFVVVVSLSDTVGRLAWPLLSDRIGGANAFLAMFLLQAVAFFLMPVPGAGSFAVFCILASAVTSCYRGGYATMSALTAAYYGPRDIGTIYGGILTASSVAGFGAPLLLARSADLTGSYLPALYATGGLMLVGAVVPLALRPPAVLSNAPECCTHATSFGVGRIHRISCAVRGAKGELTLPASRISHTASQKELRNRAPHPCQAATQVK